MKKKKWPKVVGIIIGVCACLYLIGITLNACANLSLRKYIKTFAPVEYAQDRIVPTLEDGYYTITTDEELRIMHLTDIHIGGGIWSYKNDKKTIFELISMLQKEKPDIAILGGDNTYCVPGIGFNGGFTGNNKMAAKTLISLFNNEQVYFTTVLGNHDTEAFDYADRQEIGDLYMSDYAKYCFFDQNFTDPDADTVPSVSNQFVVVKNSAGDITKLLLMLDTNAYEDEHFITTAQGKYDVIHQAQVDWVKETITELSKKAGLPEGEYLKTLCFLHIPMGEFRTAVDDIITEVKDDKGNIIEYIPTGDTENTVYVEGVWDESICYGGSKRDYGTPDSQDTFFETVCDEMKSVEAVFCGHDHVNNAVVMYKGVMLSYGYSLDNEAYGSEISKTGLQRGATIITLKPDGEFSQVHKNAYLDYGISTSEIKDVQLNQVLYPESLRSGK